MGCPYVYYKLALQYFAHALARRESAKLAKELAEESSDDRLEAFILEKKMMMSEKDFYYTAGKNNAVCIRRSISRRLRPIECFYRRS